MYSVVTLQDSDEVMVAPSMWLSPDKKQCYWPPFKSQEKCMEAVQSRLRREVNGKPWEKLNIYLNREYVSFEKATEVQKEIKEQKKRQFQSATARTLEKVLLPQVTSSTVAADAKKKELLQMLRDVKRAVQENSTMIKKLLKDSSVAEAPSSVGVPSEDTNASLTLPLRTFDDVARIERELNNETIRQKFVNYLSRLGGFGAKDVIKNIMQQVLTDDLAKNFNWQGRGNKKAFSRLILTDVIREAASRQSVTRVDCETEIKKYLWNQTN